MTDIETEVAQCNGCGAPLLGNPSSLRPVHCEYCDLTNYLRKSQGIAPDESSVNEEVESEHYYLLYQESQKILENFPGELAGEEVGKIRIKMQVGQYAFPLLIVLDDLPEKPFIDGPNVLREVINCEINDLNTMKDWIPGTSSVLDVLEEIYQISENQLPQKMEGPSTTSESKSTIKEKNPLIRQILESYDATPTRKEIKINFYAQTGEVIPFTIKRKKNYPIGLESEVLSRYPLIRGPLEDYAKGRIDLITVLAEIERLFYV